MGLDAHALLGTHKNASAVHMGLEVYAFLPNAAQFGKGKHLESAAVGEDGTIPVEELMQTAQLVNHAVAGTDVQMVRVGQLDLTVQIVEIHGGDTALDGGTGAHIHENRRFNGAVYGLEPSAAGASFFFEKRKFCHNIGFPSVQIL